MTDPRFTPRPGPAQQPPAEEQPGQPSFAPPTPTHPPAAPQQHPIAAPAQPAQHPVGTPEPHAQPAAGTPGYPAQPTNAPDTPAPKRTERPHPLTPLARGWVLLVGFVIWFGREFIPDGSGRSVELPSLSYILGGLGILVVLLFVISLAGWWFTRFVIDDDEFRYETGALFRSSKVVPFERIQTVDITQPLVARLFGLAELKIDAGSESMVLRYLTRTKAYQFRDYLIARATGHQISTSDSALAPTSGPMADVGAADDVLIRLNPRWIVIAFFASAEFLITVAVVIISLVLVFVVGWWWAVFPLLLPSVAGLFTMVGRKMLNQFNYTLSRSAGLRRHDNLRVSRGLTNLTSQSVPTDRIQGVRLRQSFLWRPWDLWQIDISVLGQNHGGEDTKQDIGSLLLPPAPPAEVRTALTAIWPDVDLHAVPLREVPSRVRWLRPITAPLMRWGWDEKVVVTRTGRLGRVLSAVPHAKAQSVAVHQGPLQRRLDLASVAVHTTAGPVTLRADHLPPTDARELMLGELARARAARRPLTFDATRRTGPDVPPPMSPEGPRPTGLGATHPMSPDASGPPQRSHQPENPEQYPGRPMTPDGTGPTGAGPVHPHRPPHPKNPGSCSGRPPAPDA